MRKKLRAMMIVLIVFSTLGASAQAKAQVPAQAQPKAMKSLEFKNQEIRDILFVQTEMNDTSIVFDEIA